MLIFYIFINLILSAPHNKFSLEVRSFVISQINSEIHTSYGLIEKYKNNTQTIIEKKAKAIKALKDNKNIIKNYEKELINEEEVNRALKREMDLAVNSKLKTEESLKSEKINLQRLLDKKAQLLTEKRLLDSKINN